MTQLKNKNCLITGAASGIGRALSIGLAKEGTNLFIVGRTVDQRLHDVEIECKKYGVTVYTGSCNIVNINEVQILAKEVTTKMGKIDLLINNAGIGMGSFTEHLEDNDWTSVLDVNLWSIIYAIKIFLPKMLEQGGGHIVNTASAAGIIGLPYHLPYVASKFAVVGISESIYSEFCNRGIKVSIICPSAIKTNIFNNSNIQLRKSLKNPDKIPDLEQKASLFKDLFWQKYTQDSVPIDRAIKKYIQGIKKELLYIFDKPLISIGLGIKGLNQFLYKRILKKQGQKYNQLITNIITELGINE